MSFSVDVLANIAIELQRGIGHQDRFQRLITTLRQVLECDASALLRYDSRQFIPLAIDGLAKDVLGRRFALEGHPRLEAIARAGDVVRFPADSELPDPYDGLIPGQESLKVHACVGLPLFAGQNLIGALTLDGMQPDQFDVFSDEELRLIAALAAGALSNALLIEQLESQNMLPGDAAPFEAVKQTQMIGLSPGMTQLKKEIEIVAASDLNVLISGETGTGKELVAKAIHEASPRAVNPLVYLNCAALPESVAESELFGHVKGAFTGAISNRSGKFEMADNGTLFLDEIGELSLALQAKLLRVLQYGDIQRVGDDRSLRVDVRVLAATNRDLREEVLAGRFRADLFHRLSVFPLSVPPLRERLRAEVRKNMERELKSAIRNRVKSQAIEGLVKANDIDVPAALIDSEIDVLRRQAAQRFGGNEKQALELPRELFEEQAKRRVVVGLLLGEVIRTNELKADEERVKGLIEEMASAYEDPKEVIEFYSKNKELMDNMRNVALEEQAVEAVLAKAKVTEKETTFNELMNQQA